jgi:hypothetical protein
MLDHNLMNELRHVAADRYQRAGGGGAHKVYTSAKAYDTARGYDQLSPWRQAVYRARVQFKSVCDRARGDFSFAPVAYDLAREETREALQYAVANIPF